MLSLLTAASVCVAAPTSVSADTVHMTYSSSGSIDLPIIVLPIASGKCGSDLKWKLYDDGRLTITGTGAMNDYDTSGNRAPWYGEKITQITLPAGITYIGANAFNGCSGLAAIIFGGTAAQWSRVSKGNAWNNGTGNYTLKCSDLTEEPSEEPSRETSEESRDESREEPSEEPSEEPEEDDTCGDNLRWSLSDGGVLTVSGSGRMTDYGNIVNRAPWYGRNVRSVIIEEGATSIGQYAFAGCRGLKTVSLPKSIETIGSFAFRSCTSLETINFGSTQSAWNSIAKSESWDSGISGYKIEFSLDFSGSNVYGIEPGTRIEKLKEMLGNGITVSGAKNGLIGTGTKITVKGKTYTVVIKGDIDGDGKISAADYIRVRKHILRITKLDGAALLAAHASTDVSKQVSAADYIAIRMHILKKKPLVQ